MKTKKFYSYSTQMVTLGNKSWSVARLITLARGLKVMKVPLDHLNVYSLYEKLTLRDMVMHMQAVNDADLSFPIMLDEDGDIFDGRHRIMKALLQNEKHILVVRFDENPTPCKTQGD